MKSLLALLLLVTALPASAAPPAVEISNAWVRAVPPVADSTAAYFILHNRGNQPLELTGARAGFAARAMLHEVSGPKDERRMRHLDSVAVPVGGQVRFRPGGRHLMLTGLERVPAEGESVEICLMVSGEELCHDFTVRRNVIH